MKVTAFITAAALVALVNVAGAQTKPATPAPAPGKTAPAAPATGVKPPADYVIGAGDVLTVTYRDEKEMTGDHLVRPDGKITIPLGIGDIEVLGATTQQVTERLEKASSAMFVKPTITVGVKAINSRKVSITGFVEKPGQYDILGPMDVLELISLAGGLREFTSGKEITIIRTDGGQQRSFRFNYKEVLEGKKLEQNIQLKPGDRVLVPE
jgi:polysaccharide export outer membrane protein